MKNHLIFLFVISLSFQYIVFFPGSGNVKIDPSGSQGTFDLYWLNVSNSQWLPATIVNGRTEVPLTTPEDGENCLEVLHKSDQL